MPKEKLLVVHLSIFKCKKYIFCSHFYLSGGYIYSEEINGQFSV